ncbi:MAG: hypothetical protein VXZ58_06440, partial [Actinomycetota bacterium]|nr:hypothetical protein [Actinomycetota bacterium]
MRNVAWELAGQDGSSTTLEEDKQQMFEIMIPWVLRNLMRRVTELGSRESTSGITELENMIDKHCYQPTSCLIVPELKTLLGKLGIQVTREVLRELCKRYAAECGAISDKWGVVENARRLEAERARRKAEEKERLKHLYGSDFKSGMVDQKGDWVEGKSTEDVRTSKDGAHDVSRDDAKAADSHSRAESKDQVQSGANDAKGVTTDASSDAKGDEHISESVDELLSDTREKTEGMLELERMDADYGVDLYILIADIKNGRAFKPLFISNQAEMERNASVANKDFSASLNKGIDTFCDGDESRIKEMNNLLSESKNGDDEKSNSAIGGSHKLSSTQAKVNMDHFGGSQTFSHSNTHCAFELPA